MANKESISLEDEGVELIVDGEKYYKIDKQFTTNKGIISPIIDKLKENSNTVKNQLYKSKTFIDIVKNSIPKTEYQVLLTNNQKKELAKGSIELMTSKDGNLLASLINPKTKKIIGNVKLGKNKISPNINKSLNTFFIESQLALIAQEIQNVQLAVENVRKDLLNDKIAIVNSCRQKLNQVLSITDSKIKKEALIQLVFSSEDVRNQLMLKQVDLVNSLKSHPKSLPEKIAKNNEKQKDKDMNDLRECLNAFNVISIIECIGYQELGEYTAQKMSLQYYGDFINNTYLSDENFLDRLDSLDPSPKKYWSVKLPVIYDKIKKINKEDKKLLEMIENEK